MNEPVRCKSSFCIIGPDNIRGRLFTPQPEAQSVALVWCPDCIKLSTEMQFFSSQTANMIRRKYKEMRIEDLPREAAALITVFTRDILSELKEEL